MEILKELGRGASSYVQLVRDQKSNKRMALKVINVFDKNMRAMLMREIKTLYKCDCHALVRVSAPSIRPHILHSRLGLFELELES